MTATADTIVRNWFDQVWNQGSDSAIDQIMAADAVAHGLPGGPCCGPTGFRPVFETFRGAFPDIHIDVEQTVAQGDKVAAYCHVTGTHTGESLGIAPTGRRVDFHGVTIAKKALRSLRPSISNRRAPSAATRCGTGRSACGGSPRSRLRTTRLERRSVVRSKQLLFLKPAHAQRRAGSRRVVWGRTSRSSFGDR